MYSAKFVSFVLLCVLSYKLFNIICICTRHRFLKSLFEKFLSAEKCTDNDVKQQTIVIDSIIVDIRQRRQ